MAHAFFDNECVCFVAGPPAIEFGQEEKEGYDEHGDGPFAATGCLRYVLRFCFCFSGREVLVYGFELGIDFLKSQIK